ncbi:MAG: IgGFc-binding protein, partial [Myxococcales bacterium]|nr:IgGFc-binding protein [Myxococcales bacterium]
MLRSDRLVRSSSLLTFAVVLVACNGDDTSTGTDTASTATITATATATATATTTASGTGTDSDSDGTMSGTASAGETTGTTGTTTNGTDSTTTMDPTTGTTTMGVETTTSGSSTTGPDCTLTCDDEGTMVMCDDMVVEDCGANNQYCAMGECVDTPCDAAFKEQRSEGCEFWSVKTGLISAGNGACFAAFVANTWSEPVHINVEYQGQQLPVESFARIPSGQGANIVYDPYDANQGLPVGEVAILFLSRGPGSFPSCPGNLAAVTQETAVTNTGRGDAFHITTDFPVAAYQMLPYGGGSVAATSATLLLPSGTWDTNYIAINAFTKSQIVSDGYPHIVLVGNEDNTTVTIQPKVAIQGGNGVNPAPANVPTDYTLNRGETIQIAQSAELTGSPILADKPFALFGGATCLNVPINAVACDGAHQQVPPVKALGND